MTRFARQAAAFISRCAPSAASVVGSIVALDAATAAGDVVPTASAIATMETAVSLRQIPGAAEHAAPFGCQEGAGALAKWRPAFR